MAQFEILGFTRNSNRYKQHLNRDHPDKEDLIAALAEIRAALQTISCMKNHADNHEAVVHLDAIDELLLKMTLRLNAQKSEYKMKSSRRSVKEHPFS